MSTDTSVDSRSICRPIYRSRGAQNTHDPGNAQSYDQKVPGSTILECSSTMVKQTERAINTTDLVDNFVKSAFNSILGPC